MKKEFLERNVAVTNAQRVVVKIGSRVLVQNTGRPNLLAMENLVRDLAMLRLNGIEVVVVTSGAIGAGIETLGWKTKPDNLPDLQMAAAVGQSRLMARYDQLFSACHCSIGQVLLTYDDLTDRQRHLNARNTMLNLMRHRMIPIVNENDVVSVDEIRVGDNDVLASLVALLVEADLLVLLTTTNGLYEMLPIGRKRRVKYLDKITNETLQMASGKGSHLSTGGMSTKLQAAQRVSQMGTPVVIADGRSRSIIYRIFTGADVGTFVAGRPEVSLSKRKRWIAYFNRPAGGLVVDEGACQAILKNGKSLLPIGIKQVEGDFPAGAVVNIYNQSNVTIARGLVSYSSDQLRLIMGRRTSEIEGLLGSKDYEEAVHHDNMAPLVEAE